MKVIGPSVSTLAANVLPMSLPAIVKWLVITNMFLAACSLAACSNEPQDRNSNQAPSSPPAYEGYHDVTNCNGIMGWGWDKNRPDYPIEIDVYDGDSLLATVNADDFRPDLLNAHIGNGRHGFTYPVPPRLKDGKEHSIRMKFAGTNVDLLNTPKVITCNFGQ